MNGFELRKRYQNGATAGNPLSLRRVVEMFPNNGHNLQLITEVNGVCSADMPQPGRVCFFDNLPSQDLDILKDDVFLGMLVIVPIGGAGWLSGPHLAVQVPREAYAIIVSELFGYNKKYWNQDELIDPTAEISEDVTLSIGVTVGRGSSIGSGTRVFPNVVIGPNVHIGRNCIIKSGTVIGQPGFGVLTSENGLLVHLPQVGGVVIEDDVELGSLNTVCSGTIYPTVIGYNVKCDDHVHIAHNCAIGSHTIITACAEFSGSVTVGERCWIGPNSSIRNGVSLGDGAFIGIGSNVVKSVLPEVAVAGNPAKKLLKKIEVRSVDK